MSRLVTTGYETGDVAEAGASTIGANMTMSCVTSNPTPRVGGAYCLKWLSSTTAMAVTYKAFALGAAKTDVWVRFAIYLHAWSGAAFPIATAQDSGGGAQTNLTFDPSSGLITARQGGSQTGTVFGTATSAMSQDAWHLIEWRIQITSATAGIIEVWLDGTRVINFSGDNTATATLNVQTIQLGLGAAIITGQLANNTFMAYDDIAINDTAGTANNGRPGDGRVLLLSPTGAGSSTVLTRGGTDSGANWSQVDDLPPSMTDYVLSATATDRDLYAMSDLGPQVTAINVVEELLLAQNSDAGAGSIGPTIKSGATISEATAVTLGTAAAYVVGRWETDPNTSAAWTLSAVQALEAGVTVR